MDSLQNMLSETAGIGGCGACSAQSGGGKRKLSAYQKFMKGEMKKLKLAHPAKKASELMKMAAKNWRAVRPATAPKTATRKSTTRKSTTRKSTKK